MPTSHLAFRALPFKDQLPLVWQEGTFVAQRQEGEMVAALYRMDGGFLCEVYLEQQEYAILRVLPFTTTDTARLAPYTYYVRLNDLTDT